MCLPKDLQERFSEGHLNCYITVREEFKNTRHILENEYFLLTDNIVFIAYLYLFLSL